MPWYPGAKKRPISGHTDGPMRSHTGAVLHVNQSNGNLFNWFNGPHDVSAHFEVYKNGAIEQYLDTNTSSWCQMNGNLDYVSIETEGYTSEPLTDAQIASCAKIMAWLHATHGIALQLAEHPGEPGLGWHGMGGAAWGNHPGCPGTLRKAQRARILHAVTGTAHPAKPTPKGNTVANPTLADLDKKLDKLLSLFVGTDGETHTVERTLAHVTQGEGYYTKKGRRWSALFRRSDAPKAGK